MVRVPATSANLGPGFDAIGMAVDIWNEIIVERAEEFSIHTEGEGMELIPTDVSDLKDGKESKHLVMSALRKAFEYAGEFPMPPVKVTTRNMVPVCSGFGSSSSAIVGGLIAGLVLAGKELKVKNASAAECIVKGVQPEELLHLATQIEGHPDNVAPAIYGGIQLSIQTSSNLDPECPASVMSRRIPYPSGLRLVAYVPTEKARLRNGLNKTDEMRNLLKPMIPRRDAVVNIQRTALLIDALHRGDLNSLRFGTRDALHQPMRGEHAYQHLDPMMRAALTAGAHGAFLSGAGPTVMAICSGQGGDIFVQRSTERQEGEVAAAMKKALGDLPLSVREAWGGGQFYIVSPTDRGAHVVSAEPKFSDGLATFGSLDGSL
jgi:homoserine kinase